MAGKKTGPPRSPIGRQVRQMLDQRCIEDAIPIIETVIKAALDGDITAAQTILNRIYPTRRGAVINFEPFEVRDAKDIAAAYNHYEKLAASGKLTLDELGILTSLVERKAKAFELIEQARAIDEMSAQIAELKALSAPRAA